MLIDKVKFQPVYSNAYFIMNAHQNLFVLKSHQSFATFVDRLRQLHGQLGPKMADV